MGRQIAQNRESKFARILGGQGLESKESLSLFLPQVSRKGTYGTWPQKFPGCSMESFQETDTTRG